MTDEYRDRTAAIQKSIETGDRAPLQHFDSRSYTQHNLALGDGFGALLEFLDWLPTGTSRVRPLRAFQDGDVSFGHLEYYFEPMGALVGFEIHRWHDGKIVEHWDALQPIDAYPSDDARPWVTDGTMHSADLDRTLGSKTIVSRFVDEVLIGKNSSTGQTLIGDLVDHAGTVGDDAATYLERVVDGNRVYDTRHKVLCEGNFALALSEGSVGGVSTAFFDLFRLESDLIVEHWEISEFIPEQGAWKNENGKF